MGWFNNFSQDDQENGGNKTIFGIICVTVLFFIAVRPGNGGLAMQLVLMPAAVRDLQLWRIVSSLLVNLSGWNLFFEMFALYIFGTIITPPGGKRPDPFALSVQRNRGQSAVAGLEPEESGSAGLRLFRRGIDWG